MESTKSAKPEKNRVKIGVNSKNRLDKRNELNNTNELNDKNGFDNKSKIGGNKIRNNKVTKNNNYQKISKSKKIVCFLVFLILGARLAFIKLRQIFVKTLILQYFDPEYHIWIETDVSGYIIGKIFS